MPKIESKIIIGYSNLSFLISIRYLLEISKTKKDAIRINAFESLLYPFRGPIDSIEGEEEAAAEPVDDGAWQAEEQNVPQDRLLTFTGQYQSSSGLAMHDR